MTWTKLIDKLPPEGELIEVLFNPPKSVPYLLVGKRNEKYFNSFYCLIGNFLPTEPITVAKIPLISDSMEFVYWRILELPKC